MCASINEMSASHYLMSAIRYLMSASRYFLSATRNFACADTISPIFCTRNKTSEEVKEMFDDHQS